MKFLPTFSDVFDDFFHDSFMNYRSVDTMRTDIVEQDENYVMNMELPGYQKEDIRMELKDGYLIVNALKNESKEETDNQGHVIRRERYQGSCSRNFYIGDAIHQEDIKVSFRNGELKITIPKEAMKQVEETRYIPID